MKITEEQKNKIKEEYKSFKEKMYAGKTKKEREELGQFFTPPDISIAMIEKLDTASLKDNNILDPTAGSGNLLIACLIAGADANRLFGNEYDPKMVELTRQRLTDYCAINNIVGFNAWQIHQGNALITDCLTTFGPEYDKTILKELLKKRWGLTGGWIDNPKNYKEPERISLFGDDFI